MDVTQLSVFYIFLKEGFTTPFRLIPNSRLVYLSRFCLCFANSGTKTKVCGVMCRGSCPGERGSSCSIQMLLSGCVLIPAMSHLLCGTLDSLHFQCHAQNSKPQICPEQMSTDARKAFQECQLGFSASKKKKKSLVLSSFPITSEGESSALEDRNSN